MRIVDLRSDTVTQPTPEMREAMYRAEVGDDVYGEDPTVNQLEAKGAELLGFPAGLYLASGTMGNLVAILTHTKRGEEIFLEAESHIYYLEVGGLAALGGVMPCPITGIRGKITPELLKKHYRADNIHLPIPSLLCIENTHNRSGGTVTTPSEMAELIQAAHDLKLKVHVDGARIFNAAVACKCDVKELVRGADSVQYCLSKGLGAPMGSLLVGSEEFIARARRWRKMIGGGFRQIGIMAAAGLLSLDKMVDRLAEDHRLAQMLAQGLAAIPYLRVNPELVETNIIVAYLDTKRFTGPQLAAALAQHGVKVNATGGDKIRLVTHLNVGEDDVNYALQVFAKLG